MPDDSLDPSAPDELVDDEDIEDGAVEELTSAGMPVGVPPPVLVESTVCDAEDPQALPTRRRIAVAARTSGQAITRWTNFDDDVDPTAYP